MKKFLTGAVALAAAAAIVGGGTYAQFHDEEVTPEQKVATGSFDIMFTDDTASNSAIAYPLNVTNAQPGFTNPTQYIHVYNNGSLPAQVSVQLEKVSDLDNNCTQPETLVETDCGTDGDGELDENMTLNIDGFVFGGTTLANLLPGQKALVNGPTQSGADSIFTLAPGADKWLSVDYDIPMSADNDIQTDTVSFKVHFDAVQVNP